MRSLFTPGYVGGKLLVSSLTALAVLLLAALAPGAHAQTFDFESATATANAGSHPGSLSSLAQTSGSLTATFTRENSATFDIVDASTFAGGFPASFGNRSLDPFSDISDNSFLVNFSSLIDGASIDFGDFGGDSDNLIIDAYSGLNGTGTLLDSDSVNYGAATFPGAVSTGSVSASGIQSLKFEGGSTTFPNSVYYDNLVVTPSGTPTPEPSSLAAFAIGGLGLLGLVAKARKRRTLP